MEANSNENGTFDRERVMERIRKILAYTDSPNEHEAANAMAMAQSLLNKYNLTVAEVELKEHKVPDLVEGEVDYSERWEVTLYSTVAKENCCRVIFLSRSKKINIYGRLPNVIATREMAVWLTRQLERLALQAQASYTGYDFNSHGQLVYCGTSSRQYRLNFLLGAISRIRDRLRELNAANRQEVVGMTALVLDLNREAEAFMLAKNPHIAKSSYGASSSWGYHEGQAAADGMSFVAPSRHVNSGSGRYLNSGG